VEVVEGGAGRAAGEEASTEAGTAGGVASTVVDTLLVGATVVGTEPVAEAILPTKESLHRWVTMLWLRV